MNFDLEDIYDMKRMPLDFDVKGSLEFLKKLERRLDEATNPK